MSLKHRKRLVAAACHLLAITGVVPKRLRIRIRGGPRGEGELRIKEDAPEQGSDEGDDGMIELLSACLLNEVERDIVLSLADGAKSARAIQNAIGIAGDEVPTRLKVILSGLVDRSVLIVTRDGYEVTNPAFIRIANNARERRTVRE